MAGSRLLQRDKKTYMPEPDHTLQVYQNQSGYCYRNGILGIGKAACAVLQT
jgi:hypothetical protein